MITNRDDTSALELRVRPAELDRIAPLTTTQRDLYLGHEIHPDTNAYSLVVSVPLGPSIDVALWCRALALVCARDDMLRTRLLTNQGQIYQWVDRGSSVHFTSLDAHGGLDLDRVISDCLDRAYDLERGPLVCHVLVRDGSGHYTALVAAHHIVFDGPSGKLFFERVGAAYEALRRGYEPTVAAHRSFYEYVDENLTTFDTSEIERYWIDCLRDVAPLAIHRGADKAESKVDRLTLAREHLDAIKRFCAARNCTLPRYFRALYGILLQRYSGTVDDFVVYEVLNGRPRAFADTLGGFHQVVPLLFARTLFLGRASVDDYIDYVRDYHKRLRGHQNISVALQRQIVKNEQVRFFYNFYDFALVDLLGTRARLGVHASYPDDEVYFVVCDLGDSLDLELHHQGILGADTHLLERLELLSRQVVGGTTEVPELSLLLEAERRQMLEVWNHTRTAVAGAACIHQIIEAQVERTPDAVALVCEGQQLSYREVNRRANQLASYLRARGVGPEVLVGICVERSVDMVVGLLGILKAGGAYVPLDPAYPKGRSAFMLQDAHASVLVTQRRLVAGLPEHAAQVVCLDADWPAIAAEDAGNPLGGVVLGNLAYVIYTSGSTGKPKGVMVTHGNVANFFHAMDHRLDRDPAGVWLAVTSISFDISVLELFWTLSRGFRVVLFTRDETGGPRDSAKRVPLTELDFSLFYFGTGEGSSPTDKYRLLIEGAKFADEKGFAAIWTPERHFHAFGGLYPNPSVAAAAIAAITNRIKIRAGSCVSPLHNAIRIAEEWSVVDNLSGGRVGISFASGWQPDDFVLAPENFAQRKEVMMRQIDIVRRLWRGESIWVAGPLGKDVQVQILPHPIQPELPIWITAAGSPDTFRIAGEAGCHVLTHLLGQSLDEVAEKIAVYRDAWRAAGHGPGHGHVTLMLHSFIGASDDEVKEQVRAPMKEYLLSSAGLVQRAAWSFPAFKRTGTDEEGRFALDRLSAEEMDAVLDFSFERYFETSGLLGSPDKCLRLIDQLREIGVDEVACLIDFVSSADLVLQHLPLLDAVREQATGRTMHYIAEPAGRHPMARLIEEHGVTHLQCTPSMASLLLDSPGSEPALRSLRQLLIGGEAFPVSLARKLRPVMRGSILNLYGPTETTIWSSMFALDGEDGPAAQTIPIGRPIDNTQFYILDRQMRPVPVGVIGELYIGGDGVARGYLNRPGLTAERFVADPFGEGPGRRLYRTGDLARYREDGIVDYVGRVDNQVKLRGYRIELGEIESVLGAHPAVRENAVVVRGESNGQERLVAYVVGSNARRPAPDELHGYLAERLPEYMVPAAFEVLDTLPRTPNEKLDRLALPEPTRSGDAGRHVAPRDEVERELTAIWERELRVAPIGITDNFFHLGGHSLLAVRIFSQIEMSLGKRLPLVTLFSAPTIEQLADKLRQSAVSGHAPGSPASPLSMDPRASVVPVQTGGTKPPLFYAHTHWVGGALYCNAVARVLGPDQPLYVLDPYVFDGLRVPPTLEAMAAAYIKSIRAVQPAGPYVLAGFCGGSLIAYEMAQQLRAEGQAVDLLVSIEPMPGPIRSIRLAGRLLRRVGGLLRLSPDRQLDAFLRLRYVSRTVRRWHDENTEHVDRLMRCWRDEHPRRLAPLPSAEALRLDWMGTFGWAVSDYVPRPYPGKVAYLFAGEIPTDRTVWWGKAVETDSVEIHVIPGTHQTCRTEHLHDLAECLRMCLSNAQEEERKPVASRMRPLPR